jgi:hypothetical protein
MTEDNLPSAEQLPTSFGGFLWLWVKTALPPAWAWADGASFAIGLIALYLAKRHPEFAERMTDLSWQIPMALFVFILLMRLIVAPFSIYRAQREETETLRRNVTDLTEKLEARKKSRELADALTGLFRKGVTEILNAPPAGSEELPEWRRVSATWLSDVLSTMLAHDCTPQELNHVEILGLFPVIRSLHPDPEIARALSEFASRLQRVADVSTSHAQSSVPT